MSNRFIEATLRYHDKFSAPMQKTVDKLSAQGKMIAKQGRDIEKTGKKVTGIGKSLTRNVSLPIAGLLTVSDKLSMDFDKSIAKMSTIADSTEVPIKKMRKQILGVSNDTGVAASEVADNVYEAISAGQKTGDAINFVRQSLKLSKAGFTDSASSLDILSTIMNAYGLKAKEVTHVSDVLIQTQNLGKTKVNELAASMGKVIPTAQAYGVSFEKLSAGYVTLTKNGIRTRFATTYMNSMLGELGKSGTKVSKILKAQTGKSFDELMKSGMSLTDVLKIAQKGADKTGVKFMDIWGNTNSAKAAKTLIKHSKDYDESLKKMGKSAGTTKNAFKKMEGTDSAKMERSINRMKNAAIQLGAPVMQIVAPAMEQIGKWAEKANNWLSKLSPHQQKLIVKLLAFIALTGPVVTAAGKMITGYGRLLKSVGSLGMKLDKAGDVFGAFNGRMRTSLSAGASSMSSYLSNMKIGLKMGFQSMGNMAKAGAGKIKFAATALASGTKTAFITMGNGIAMGARAVGRGFAMVGRFLLANPWILIITGIAIAAILIIKNWDKVKAFFAKLWGPISKVLKAFKNGVIGFAKASAEKFKKFSSDAKEHLVKRWRSVSEVAVKIAEKVKVGFAKRFSASGKAVKLLSKVCGNSTSGIKGYLGGMIKFVEGVFSGNWKKAWSGVVQIFKTVWNNIKAVAKAPINAIIDMVNTLIGGLNKLSFTIPNKKWIPKAFRGANFGIHLGSIPRLATGTNDWPGGLAQINEKGGEIVNLPKHSQVIPHDISKGLASRKTDITININSPVVRSDDDIDSLTSKIADKLEEALNNVAIA